MKQRPQIINREHWLVNVVDRTEKAYAHHVWCVKCFKRCVSEIFPTYRNHIYHKLSATHYCASYENVTCDKCGQKNENPNQAIVHTSIYDGLHRFDGGHARKHVRQAKRRKNNYGGHGF